jgi:hypothetical protein
MRAWKRPDGRYHLDDSDEPRHRRAYHRRREIRERGGRWSDTYGVWFVPEDALEALGAKRVYGVILEPYCHMSAEFTYVDQADLDAGHTIRGRLCTLCDSHHGPVGIIEVLGENDVAWAVYEAEFRDKLAALA